MFTPGNAEFSGHLPVLETSSDALRRLYWWGALGVLWFRRDFPGNVLGRSYDTLMPNYWATTTFIWDFSLSSLTHALLDGAIVVVAVGIAWFGVYTLIRSRHMQSASLTSHAAR